MVMVGAFVQVRMLRAVEAGKGCPVYLKRTHQKTLKIVSIESLKKICY